MRAAKGIAENGRFDAFADLPTMEDITAAFSPKRGRRPPFPSPFRAISRACGAIPESSARLPFRPAASGVQGRSAFSVGGILRTWLRSRIVRPEANGIVLC